MSSPKSHKQLEEDNSNDFNKISVFLKSVDETKPLGKLVKIYAEQKYWNGYFTGLFTGLCLGFTLGAFFGITVRRARS